ncbi:MAG: XdhC family protein [Bacteroidales bacterium]
MTEIFAKLEEIRRAGKRASLVIVIHTSGSTPRKAGSKMIVTADGEIYGTIGGGNIEQKVKTEAMRIAGQMAPEKLLLDLGSDAEMHCGGSVEVYIEPVFPAQDLVIFGAGHVGSALAKFAENFGFRINLVDNRSEMLEKFSGQAVNVIHDEYISVAREYTSDANTYFVVTTPRHAYDQELTGILGVKPFRYLGMIGSRKKVATARKHYLDEKILTEEQINRIDMPIGLPFNAQTPEEIAISILAKLIDVKNS